MSVMINFRETKGLIKSKMIQTTYILIISNNDVSIRRDCKISVIQIFLYRVCAWYGAQMKLSNLGSIVHLQIFSAEDVQKSWSNENEPSQ